MININNNESNTIIKFLKKFTNSVVKIFSEKFGKSVFDNIDFSVISASNLSSIDTLKVNNALYKFSYNLGTLKCSFLVLIPEEFISIASDLILQGNFENLYQGSLSEIEVNASLQLFNSVLEDMKNSFKSFYGKEIMVSEDSEIVVKNTLEYNELFNNTGFNFSILYNLKLDEDKEFPIIVLTNAYKIKQLLTNIGVLEEISIPNISKIMPKEMENYASINKIADIKINMFAELGRSKLSIKQVLGLVGGSIIELETYDHSDIKVFANGLEVAKAQIVVVDDHFGIKITEIISPEERYKDK